MLNKKIVGRGAKILLAGSLLLITGCIDRYYQNETFAPDKVEVLQDGKKYYFQDAILYWEWQGREIYIADQNRVKTLQINYGMLYLGPEIILVFYGNKGYYKLMWNEKDKEDR